MDATSPVVSLVQTAAFTSTPERCRLHPDVLVLRRSDGSACLLHLDGRAYVVDAQSVTVLDRLVSPDAELGSADVEAVSDLLRERLINLPGMHTESRGGVWPPLFRWTLRATRRLRMEPGRHALVLLALARIGVAGLRWAGALRAWEDEFPQPAAGVADHPLAVTLGQSVRRAATAGIVGYACKEYALATLALVREHGISAELVLGVRHLPLGAHVWVETSGHVVGDDPERCWQFEPVARYSGSGYPKAL
jgi:hypothetical protein